MSQFEKDVHFLAEVGRFVMWMVVFFFALTVLKETGLLP
jgi:hypothetical protein